MKQSFLCSALAISCAAFLLISNLNAQSLGNTEPAITFDDAVTVGLVEGGQSGTYANLFRDKQYNGPSSYSVGGLTFSANNGTFFLGNSDGAIYGDGSNMLHFAQYDSSSAISYLTITKTGGGLFDLYSFDAAISYYNKSSEEVLKVNSSNNITIAQNSQTFVINAKGVSQVTISSIPMKPFDQGWSGGYFAIDNVKTVPEPAPTPYQVPAGPVGGIINQNTVWADTSKPYTLASKVQVAPRVTLTVAPGVRIDGGRIEVFGNLNIGGTEPNPVVLSNVDVAPGANSSTDPLFKIMLRYAKISGGSIYKPTGNALYGSLSIESCHVEGIEDVHIWYPTSGVIIRRNVFQNCGVINAGSSDVDVIIENNLFYNCSPLENWATYGTAKMMVRYNTFLTSAGALAVRLRSGHSDSSMDARENYWGTANEAEIRTMIYDRNADLSTAGIIPFQPYLTAPHPETPVAPTPMPTPTPTPTPTPSPSASPSPSPTPTPSPSPTPTPSPSASPSPSPTPTPTPPPKDTTKPNVAVLSPKSSTSYTNADSVELVARISDNTNPAYIRFRSRAPGARTYSPWRAENLGGRKTVKTWSQTFLIPSEGEWVAQLMAFDDADNRSDVRTVRIVADRSRPLVAITSSGGSIRRNSYVLKATVSDNYRPGRLQYRLKAPGDAFFSSWQSSRLSAPDKVQSWQDTLTLARRGTWQIEVQAQDAAGNTSAVKAISVRRAAN